MTARRRQRRWTNRSPAALRANVTQRLFLGKLPASRRPEQPKAAGVVSSSTAKQPHLALSRG